MAVSTPGLVLPSLGPKGLTVAFDGGDLSADAGFIPLALADQQLQLCARLAAAIPDLRDPAKVQHSVFDLLRQRVYQIAAGYADANDAHTLRGDPLLKAALDKEPQDPDLASQSTLSRFENSLDRPTLAQLGRVLLAVFLERCGTNPRQVVLDLDPFADPAHGTQQGVLFNGYYDTHCYLPLYLCGQVDGSREYVIGALLRSGNAPATQYARFLLRVVVRALRARFPQVKILVRGDCAFGVAKILRACRHLQVDYCFGLAQNAALHRLSTQFQLKGALAYTLRRRHQGAGAAAPCVYGEFRYRAKTWQVAERVIVKVEVTQGQLNPRFVVTSLPSRSGATGRSSRDVYRFYSARGNPENRIKEFKNDLQADRLSCELKAANQFRLLLHAAAYNLYQTLQDALAVVAAGTDWARAQVGTLRERLGKVAARILSRRRGLRVQLPTSYPWPAVWRRLVAYLAAALPGVASG